MRVAPEGRPFVAVAISVLGAFTVVAGAWGSWWWAALGLWVPLALWVPWFFRDPARSGPRGAHLAIAPADGRVVNVVEVHEPTVIGGPALRVSVFMNVLNVHVNRYPVDGEVTHRNYHAGRFFNASLDKASEHNERMSIGLRTPHGPVLVRQIAGLIARRIVTDAHVGDPARQGERLGIIRFGSRVDTFFPPSIQPRVAVGDHTVAGVTVIGEWPA